MASQYICGDNYEINVQNCAASILNAVENYAVDKLATLSKNDINGLRLLEYNNFDSRLGNVEKVNYQYTRRLNERYALTVSGEYSDNSFTVLFMIADRQKDYRFGFKVKISADLNTPKTLHIIENIPIFGVHCVINYNPETKFYVFSIRPPLTRADYEIEKTCASSNSCALFCLDVDFVRGDISFEVYNYGRKSRSSLLQVFRRFLRPFKHDRKVVFEVEAGVASSLWKALSGSSVAATETLTYQNVAGIKNLNLTCSRIHGTAGVQNSIGVDYTKSLGDDCDLTASGEYSNGSITVTLLITDKKSGISFGYEVKINGIKSSSYIVIKIPGSNIEIVLKIDVAVIGAVGKFIYACIRSSASVINLKAAANHLINLEVDFHSKTIIGKVLSPTTCLPQPAIHQFQENFRCRLIGPPLPKKKFCPLTTAKQLSKVAWKVAAESTAKWKCKIYALNLSQAAPYMVAGGLAVGLVAVPWAYAYCFGFCCIKAKIAVPIMGWAAKRFLYAYAYACC